MAGRVRLAVLGIVFMVCSACPAAAGIPPAVTRWMHPLGLPREIHDVPRFGGSLEMEAVACVSASRESVATPPRICVVVHQDVQGALATGLDAYLADISQSGFSAVVYAFQSGGAEALRDHLRALYQETASLAGAVLIGEIPYVLFEMMEDWGDGFREYEDFPCDVFYMDLDGTWTDALEDGQVQAGNGRYDTRAGNLDLEIWVCRMRTANLSLAGTEAELLDAYFQKNHAYRTGGWTPPRKALAYVDDDWSSMGPDDAATLEAIYPGQVAGVWDAELTTASDYRVNRLPEGRELVLLRSHGYPGGHGFYEGGGAFFNYVMAPNYLSDDPPALFHSLFVCSGSDFATPNSLASLIAFNPAQSGLLAWGSTKTGGMWEDTHFYGALSAGKVFGEAFRTWFNTVQRRFPLQTPPWWYGMVLIGDASLKPRMAEGCTYTAAPGRLDVGVAGGQTSFFVSTFGGCPWMVTGVPGWIHAAASSGNGPADVVLAVDPNVGKLSRSVVLSLEGVPVGVVQEAVTGLSLDLDGNRVVDSGDLVVLLQTLSGNLRAGEVPCVCPSCGDSDGNNVLDALDGVFLRSVLSGSVTVTGEGGAFDGIVSTDLDKTLGEE
ncbi:MAG: BACON domain-containing protein [Acidobacteria bacterium]|nr:BACON domain-containing protein [Acidobacteriota bacterium]